MTLDEHDPPLTIEDAYEYGRRSIVAEMEELAEREARTGDGRALRIIQRLAAAVRRVK